MKIAVASDDGKHIAHHFGRTRGFLVYSVENNDILEKNYIQNNFTGHAQGHAHQHHHEHHHEHHHSHEGILGALRDCEVIISMGMGRRLLDDFESAGKIVYVTMTELADEAVNQYMNGNLEHNPDKSCQH